jgi:hypothetical protein
MRIIGFILTLAVAGAIAAAGPVKVGTANAATPASLELSFTKWFAPGYPNFAGVVGGDVTGRFGGAALEVAPSADGRSTRITAIYMVIAAEQSRSLTMHIDGIVDNATGTAVFNGRVVDGRLTGARVHVEWKAIGCGESPNGTCYQGTIAVRRASGASGD